MEKGKKVAIVLAFLAFAFAYLIPFCAAVETPVYLRGSSQRETVNSVSYYAASPIAPDSSSVKTTISKTTLQGVNTFESWITGELQVAMTFSGPSYVYFSKMYITGDNAKYRTKYYDYSPIDGSTTLIAQSDWYDVPSMPSPAEAYTNHQNYTFGTGHRAMLVIEYDAKNGNGTMTVELDEGSVGNTVSYACPTGNTYAVSNVKSIAMLVTNLEVGTATNSGSCAIECSSNADCDDGNPLTEDVCNNPGNCSSSCSNRECSIACFSDSGCDDNNSLTKDICNNAGSCNAYCSHSLIAFANAQEEENEDCTVACSSNADCDDGNPLTTDSCNNAGSCSSKCTYSECKIACSSDSECDDGDPLTTDSCTNAGTCSAACLNVNCKPLCRTNADCDDNLSTTVDVCAGSGRCSAVCAHMEKCGDGKCEIAEDETECSCPADCGSCYEIIQGIKCMEKNCVGKSCNLVPTLGCCGNNICEINEDYASCPEDCKPKKVDFTLEGYDEGEKHLRGEKVTFKASLVADGIKLNNAEIYAEGFFGRIKLYNDGIHDDAKALDNIYANSIIVGDKNKEGSYVIKFSVNAAGSKRAFTKSFIISPKLDLTLSTDKEFYLLSDSINISGSLKKKGVAVDIPIRLVLRIPAENEILVDKNINIVAGSYSFSYKSSTIQKPGTWKVELYAEDLNGNYSRVSKDFNVLKPGSIVSLKLGIGFDGNVMKRGEKRSVNIDVFDPDGSRTDANVVLEVFGKLVYAQRIGQGKYSAEVFADFSVPSGLQKIKVFAEKNANSIFYSGTSTFDVNIAEAKIVYDIIEPKGKHYLIGDAMPIKVKLKYEDGSPVEDAEIAVNVGNELVNLKASEKGVYYAEHIVTESNQGAIKVGFDIKDPYGNYAKGGIELDVSGYSLMYYVRRYWLPVFLLLIAAIILATKVRFEIVKKIRLKMLKNKEKQIIEVIKGLQYQYFKEASIDKKTYLDEISKYEAKLNDIRESIAIAEGKLKLRK